MHNEMDNPFSVTKATEFSDLEINEYWVNFNTEQNISIETILNPKEYLPKYVIGGKGCGKTHILRYFSYPLQKIRHENNVSTILRDDKYIGMYSVLHGLNSSRFEGKGVDKYEWESIFEYYFELYICDILLCTAKEIITTLETPSIEEKLVLSILSLFNNFGEIKIELTFIELINFLSSLRRKIDSQVLNAAFTRKLEYQEVAVLFTPGDLIFGIPNAILNNVADFKDVRFIFIFDEYEKLFEWQKRFVNTLVWDKKTPVTFWIGARRHGYTTRETKSGQEMKSGSEFQPVDLDEIIRTNDNLYEQFAEKLYVNRLVRYYQLKRKNVLPNDIQMIFNNKFEQYDEQKIIEEIIEKNKKKEYNHLKNLRNKLATGLKSGKSSELNYSDSIDEIIEAIKTDTDGNPLEQKYKIFLLYQFWAKSGGIKKFKEILNKINTEYIKYKKGIDSDFKEIKDKRKKDFIAQLAKENNVKNTEYSGIGKFIELSQGNARSFILILKKTIEFAKIKGENPLEDGGKISLDSQYLAVYDTARWFYEDAELIGEEGKNIYAALRKLTEYFIEERFCDKPVDTTVSCFYIKEEELSINSISCIEGMKMHSILIEDVKGRIEKNSGRKERLFQLNKTIAPLWNLPTVVRGSIYLSQEVAEAIFNHEEHKKFERILKKRRDQLNAPFLGKKKNNNSSDPFLFT